MRTASKSGSRGVRRNVQVLRWTKSSIEPDGVMQLPAVFDMAPLQQSFVRHRTVLARARQPIDDKRLASFVKRIKDTRAMSLDFIEDVAPRDEPRPGSANTWPYPDGATRATAPMLQTATL